MGPGWVTKKERVYYKVTAVDDADNESDPASRGAYAGAHNRNLDPQEDTEKDA